MTRYFFFITFLNLIAIVCLGNTTHINPFDDVSKIGVNLKDCKKLPPGWIPYGKQVEGQITGIRRIYISDLQPGDILVEIRPSKKIGYKEYDTYFRGGLPHVATVMPMVNSDELMTMHSPPTDNYPLDYDRKVRFSMPLKPNEVVTGYNVYRIRRKEKKMKEKYHEFIEVLALVHRLGYNFGEFDFAEMQEKNCEVSLENLKAAVRIKEGCEHKAVRKFQKCKGEEQKAYRDCNKRPKKEQKKCWDEAYRNYEECKKDVNEEIKDCIVKGLEKEKKKVVRIMVSCAQLPHKCLTVAGVPAPQKSSPHEHLTYFFNKIFPAMLNHLVDKELKKIKNKSSKSIKALREKLEGKITAEIKNQIIQDFGGGDEDFTDYLTDHASATTPLLNILKKRYTLLNRIEKISRKKKVDIYNQRWSIKKYLMKSLKKTGENITDVYLERTIDKIFKLYPEYQLNGDYRSFAHFFIKKIDDPILNTIPEIWELGKKIENLITTKKTAIDNQKQALTTTIIASLSGKDKNKGHKIEKKDKEKYQKKAEELAGLIISKYPEYLSRIKKSRDQFEFVINTYYMGKGCKRNFWEKLQDLFLQAVRTGGVVKKAVENALMIYFKNTKTTAPSDFAKMIYRENSSLLYVGSLLTHGIDHAHTGGHSTPSFKNKTKAPETDEKKLKKLTEKYIKKSSYKETHRFGVHYLQGKETKPKAPDIKATEVGLYLKKVEKIKEVLGHKDNVKYFKNLFDKDTFPTYPAEILLRVKNKNSEKDRKDAIKTCLEYFKVPHQEYKFKSDKKFKDGNEKYKFEEEQKRLIRRQLTDKIYNALWEKN